MHPSRIGPSVVTARTESDNGSSFRPEYDPSRSHLQGWTRFGPGGRVLLSVEVGDAEGTTKKKGGGEAVIAARNQPPRVAARFPSVSTRLGIFEIRPMVSCNCYALLYRMRAGWCHSHFSTPSLLRPVRSPLRAGPALPGAAGFARFTEPPPLGKVPAPSGRSRPRHHQPEPRSLTDQRMEQTEGRESLVSGGRRVSALVALTILEVLQTSDRPFEVFEQEDTSITMPRRLGLSDVVERRIRTYQEETKKGRKISDEEFGDLVRLVVRRPDARAVFLECGARLAGKLPQPPKFLPRGLALALARRRVAKRLRTLFGRRVGGFGDGGFVLEGRSLLFIQSDAQGNACSLVSGLCSATLGSSVQDPPAIAHVACEARGDQHCRWGIQ